MTTPLYWHNTGPLIRYSGGTLHIEDLNPEVKTQWRMSRWEMFALGCRCIRAALALAEGTTGPRAGASEAKTPDSHDKEPG